MKYCVTINDKRYEVEVEKGSAAILSTTEIPFEIIKNINQADEQVAATTQAPKIVESSELTTEASPESGREVVKAPMAGGIINIKVSAGSAVKKGDVLLLLEAMKMENEITAHVDGTVAEIKVTKGANVSAGDILVVLK
jgi:biotin carboxyl carrier protein